MLSAPHDGYMLPFSNPNRAEYAPIDHNTRLFPQLVSTERSTLFAKKPFILYNNLHRSKFDPNRDSRECCSNSQALKAHTEYHSTMIQENFRRKFVLNGTRKYRNAIIFDIHGQSKSEDRIELGYLLGNSGLNVNSISNSVPTSIDALFKSGTYTSKENLIRGMFSCFSITI
jgi:hypothetical protein